MIKEKRLAVVRFGSRIIHLPLRHGSGFTRNWKTLLAVLWLLIGVPYLTYELWQTLGNQGDDGFGDVRAFLLTLAAWIGLPFLIWRTLIADSQTRLNREAHNTDLFARGVEALGATRTGVDGAQIPAIETRIGGILALERLSKHSQNDYGIVIETLSAYVREQCGKPIPFEYQSLRPDEPGISLEEKEGRLRDWYGALEKWIAQLRASPPAHRQDVRTAINALIRRREGRHWNDDGKGEAQPILPHVNFQGLIMEEARREFLHDEIGLSSAYLEGAAINGFHIQDSQILGPRIVHDPTQSRADPRSLAGIRIHGLRLKQARFFPIFDGSDLSFARMNEAECEGAYFRNTRVVYADFTNAKLRDVKFGLATIPNSKFDGADLRDAEFIGAVISETSFTGADLGGAEFHGASLDRVNFDDALLSGANLAGAKGLQSNMIQKAYGTVDTPLPSNVERPTHWTSEEAAMEKWQCTK